MGDAPEKGLANYVEHPDGTYSFYAYKEGHDPLHQAIVACPLAEVTAERDALQEQVRWANNLLIESEALLCDERAGETGNAAARAITQHMALYFKPPTPPAQEDR